ncbi:MAG: hypothetical protein ACLGII_05195 [Gammaproteobacteria bacterium]
MPTLPAEWIEHFPRLTSYRLGACDPEGRPSVCRALAAQLLADGRVRVLMTGDAGPRVLDAIRATGQVAALMVSPETNRTLHMKGRDAVVERVDAGCDALLAERRAALVNSLRSDGFLPDAPLIADWYAPREGDLYSITFTPWGAWNQTPGPGAGAPVELLP